MSIANRNEKANRLKTQLKAQGFQGDFIHNNFHSWQNSTSEVRVDKYYLLFSFLFVHFFFLLLGKKKKRTKKEKTSYSKDTVNDFISDFSVTSYCKNHLKIKLCLDKLTSGASPPNPIELQKFIKFSRCLV